MDTRFQLGEWCALSSFGVGLFASFSPPLLEWWRIPLYWQLHWPLHRSSWAKGEYLLTTRICVEVDLEKGIPEAVVISLDNCQHIQQLDYEQLPFKCKICHEYGHFALNYKKADPNPIGTGQEDQWQAVSRKFGNVRNRAPSSSAGPFNAGSKSPTKAAENPWKSGPATSQNSFESLSQLVDSKVEVLPTQCNIRINSKETPSV